MPPVLPGLFSAGTGVECADVSGEGGLDRNDTREWVKMASPMKAHASSRIAIDDAGSESLRWAEAEHGKGKGLACFLSARSQGDKKRKVVQHDSQHLNGEGKFQAYRNPKEPNDQVSVDNTLSEPKCEKSDREENTK